ncbi:MAG TPA: hemolysin family protein [Sporichthya sp.]|nr:hemolysin family protein [Sporichthya sp.]
MTETFALLAAFALVLACGVFVAAEFAFLSVNRTSIEQAARSGDSGAKGVLAALQSLTTQLSGAQVGITLTNLAIGFLAEPAISDLLHGPLTDWGLSSSAAGTVGAIVALTLATIVTMVLGELVPQYLALAHPSAVARVVQRPIRMFTLATKPLSSGLNIVANRVVRAFGVEPTEELAHARNPEELVFLVQRSAEHGTLHEPTAHLLRKVLTFDDLHASDVMTPRTRVATVPATASVADLLEIARESGRSRYPVVGDTVDDVRGVASLLDAFAVPVDERATTEVARIATEPHLVPSVLPADDLLSGLLEGAAQLAIVLDEFGGLDGVVSLEDLVEELVGDVVDEHDADSPPQSDDGPRDPDTPWVISGLLRPDEVRELTGVEIPDGGLVYETLGGLVLATLGRVPEAGDHVTVGGVELTVVTMDGRRVDRVELRPTEPADSDETADAGYEARS